MFQRGVTVEEGVLYFCPEIEQKDIVRREVLDLLIKTSFDKLVK